MRSFEATAEIDAPLAAVWSAMSDVERWPVWLPSVRSVESLDPGPFAVGARYRLRQPRLPAAVWRVTALEPGRPFAFVSRTPGTVSLGEHTLEPRSLRAALEFPGRTSLEYEAGGDEAQASGPDRDRTRTTVELTLWTAEQGGRRTPVTRSPRYRPHLVLGDPPPAEPKGTGCSPPRSTTSASSSRGRVSL